MDGVAVLSHTGERGIQFSGLGQGLRFTNFLHLVSMRSIATCLLLLVGSCRDPALEAAISALGPEASDTPVGPLHRPDQPCVLCHQIGGNASAFLVGGTVYYDETGSQPVANVEVALIDLSGRVHRTTTNCAGNFFVRDTEWVPRLPIWASLVAGEHSIHMESPIYREGSCAACHTKPAGPTSAGQVFLSDDPEEPVPLPPSSCPPRSPR
jgi:hypothetical protein